MKTSPLVSIIIVNWNGKHWLEGCLPTLKKATYKNTEWIIVDNASTDGSVKWVASNYPKTTIIENQENLGFSHANNLGYKKARGEYILFLNNDTKVKPDFLEELLKPFFNDRSVGGVQSKILLMDDPARLDSIGAYLTPTGFLYHNHLGDTDKTDYDTETELYTVKGASMMFRADILKKVEVNGWIFDPSYFAYFEETDMCHRIWMSGSRIVYAPGSVIYHKMGATSSKLISARVQYHSYKNRINSYLKNFGSRYLLLVLPVHLIVCQLLSFIFLLKGSLSWSIAIERAILWNIIHFPATMQNRFFVQNHIRSVSDNAFIPKLMKSPEPGHYLRFLGEFLRINKL